jgi:hypothetical protein
MTERIYQMSASLAQVDSAGTPPRPESRRSDEVSWDFPEADLADVPVLRRWLREHNATDIQELGWSEHNEPLPSGRQPYHPASVPWTPWKGPALTRRDPCEGCGLLVSTVSPSNKVAPEHVDNVLQQLTEAPLCVLAAPARYVASGDLVEAVRSAGLDAGLATHPLDNGGRALLIWSDAPLGGPAYPYGPPPCAVCGRAAGTLEGIQVFARPNYAYDLTFEADIAHWSWSTVYGQQMPLVSQAVAEFLLERVPSATFIPHGKPADPGAFLPEPYH